MIARVCGDRIAACSTARLMDEDKLEKGDNL